MTDSFTAAAPSVVVFDADPDSRNMYALDLESRGATVQPVASAADALARVRNGSPPDALIFDVAQLGMTAAAFCKVVRETAGPRPPRLILVTGWLMSPDDLATLARLGVAVHQKPVSLDELWTTLLAQLTVGR